LKQISLSRPSESESRSHLPLNGTKLDPKLAEQLLTQRLRSLDDLHKQDDLFKAIQELLKDEEFVKNLQNNKIFREQLQRAVNNQENAMNDPALRDLAKNFIAKNGLTEKELNDLKDAWKKSPLLPPSPPRSSVNPPPIDIRNPPIPPVTPPTPPAPPPPSGGLPPDAHMPEPTPGANDSWFAREFKELGRSLIKEMAESEWLRGALKDFLERGPNGKEWNFKFPENRPESFRMDWLKEHLPSGRFFNFGSFFRNWRAPSVVRGWSGPSSLPSMRMASSSDGWQNIVILLAVATAAFIMWKSFGRYRGRMGGERAWRLGPWPVSPSAVTTREDLVRAFEYLAFLALGPAAQTCHHLEVAARLGQQPALDADHRRDAAEHLALLYERARYAPLNEPLPEEELASARRELCLLAGVASA
jgi:hypothetical protein